MLAGFCCSLPGAGPAATGTGSSRDHHWTERAGSRRGAGADGFFNCLPPPHSRTGPRTYTITAAIVQDAGKAYGVTPATSTVTVTESAAPARPGFLCTRERASSSPCPAFPTQGLPASPSPGRATSRRRSRQRRRWPWLPGAYVIHANDALVSDRTTNQRRPTRR